MKDKIFFFINILIFLLTTLFFQVKSLSLENNIIIKVNNEIITTYDLENEINYLNILNPNIKKLDENEKINFSKKSIIQEKIKQIEIQNIFDNPNIPDEYLESFLKNIYTKIGIKDLNDFKKYLNLNNIKYDFVLSKIETEALWNELIFLKFSKKIKIDEDQLLKNIRDNSNNVSKSYLMSEILFEINQNEKLEQKYKEISRVILKQGFENAALKFSISETAKIGGELNWINENSLNKTIKKKLNGLQKNQFTDPITIPGGFLILKIVDTKEEKKEINIQEELDKLIAETKNNQLNRFSIMYFNRIKKDTEINEI